MIHIFNSIQAVKDYLAAFNDDSVILQEGDIDIESSDKSDFFNSFKQEDWFEDYPDTSYESFVKCLLWTPENSNVWIPTENGYETFEYTFIFLKDKFSTEDLIGIAKHFDKVYMDSIVITNSKEFVDTFKENVDIYNIHGEF